MNIKIKYNGKWPCLCKGALTVFINNKKYKFPPYCLLSGGECYFINEIETKIIHKKWEIKENRWPNNFPENLKKEVIEEINKAIPWGCCGGCI